MTLNGMTLNGLSLNGLSLNGLSLNGLATETFSNWFGQWPVFNDMVMRYVVLCAVPAGASRTYVDPDTGRSYTWYGGLGLAPDWSNGSPASLAEQQAVSACLAAHANKYGLRIPVSLLGKTAQGQVIPYSASELATYFNREGSGGSESCAPLIYVGGCSSVCTLDASGTYYASCTYNGVTYRPLTTRVRAADVFQCGDGVCQFTESCGTGDTYDSCKLDCGTCG